MLLPFQWAVLTIEEAKLMLDYIEKTTASKGLSRNYHKMQKVGMLETYNKLREFIESAAHYDEYLRPLDPYSFQTKDDFDG